VLTAPLFGCGFAALWLCGESPREPIRRRAASNAWAFTTET
jgi:hypothetical protein